MSVVEARRAAEALLAEHHVAAAPVDVEDLARRVGLKIVRDRLGDGDISALLVTGAAGAYVVVNALNAPVRQRFSVAHEIGHFVLKHQFQSGEHVHVDRGNFISQRGTRASAGIDPKEIEANQFAAVLLMPEELVRADLTQMRVAHVYDQHVEELAHRFKVSVQAMTIRLQSLRLL